MKKEYLTSGQLMEEVCKLDYKVQYKVCETLTFVDLCRSTKLKQALLYARCSIGLSIAGRRDECFYTMR